MNETCVLSSSARANEIMGDNDDFDYGPSDTELEFDSDYDLSDEVGNDFFAEELEVSDSTAKSVPYRILSFHQVKAMLESLVERAAAITGLSSGSAFVLLNAYEWDVGELASACLDSKDLTAKKLGLTGESSLKLKSEKKTSCRSKGRECPVCLEISDDFFSLECGHAICKPCFRKYTEINIFENRNLFKSHCPGNAKCRQLILKEHVRELLPGEVQRYDDLATKAFIARSPQKFRNCPSPQCDYIATRIDDVSSINIGGILCLCGTTFCFSCGLSCDHYAVPCDLACYWLAMADKEHRSSLWINDNTKKCPKCLSTIERVEGCNHMQCEQCKHEFCWLCHRDWAQHSGNSYYECSFAAQASSASLSSSSATVSTRKKSGNHNNNNNNDDKLSKKQNERLWHYMEEFDKHTAFAAEHGELNRTLHEAHNLLAWTYALLYITTNTNSKIILEELADAMSRDLLRNSPHIQQRSKALAEFMTNGETKWVIDPSLRTRLDRESSKSLSTIMKTSTDAPKNNKETC